MSVRVMTAAWSIDLPASDKLVLLALADCANDEGVCWPGLASLCVKTGKCRRSLQESLRALDAAGHITRKENPGKGMLYTVHPVAISATGGKSCTGGKKAHRPVAKSAPKPSRTIISSEAKASSPREKFKPPVGVSPEQWADFRAQRKKPLTSRAYSILTNKLIGLAEAGYPPGEMIDLAIERGWETVFKPRNLRNVGHQQHPGLGKTSAAIAGLGDWNDDRPM